MDLTEHCCLLLDGPSTEEEIGGKAFGLLQAKQGGFSVPETLVIQRSALRLALLESGLYSSVEDYLRSARDDGFDGIGDKYEFLRAQLQSIDIPADVVDELSDAVSGFPGQGSGGLAVRSSAVMEDSKGASFAGVFESWIGVQTFDELLDRIRQCWSLSWSPKALRYMSRMGIRPCVDGMAVMVQPVCDAVVSGVAYTANPDTGNPMELVISATRGLSVELMDHHGVGDRLVIDWMTGDRISESIVLKASKLVAGPNGIERQQLPPKMAREAALQVAQVKELFLQLRKLDERLGLRIDAEFLFDSDGLKILQVRPLTALPRFFLGTLSSADEAAGWKRMEHLIPFREDVPKGFVTPLFADLSDSELWARYQPDDITLGVYCQATRDIGGYRYQAEGKLPIFTDYFEQTSSMETWLERNEAAYRAQWDLRHEVLDAIVSRAQSCLEGERSLSRLISAWLEVREKLWDLNSFGWSGPQYLGWMCQMVLDEFLRSRGLDVESGSLVGGAKSVSYKVTCGLQDLARRCSDSRLVDLLKSGPLDQMMDSVRNRFSDSEFFRAFEAWAWQCGKRPPSWYGRPSFWGKGADHTETFHTIRSVLNGNAQDVRETRRAAFEKRALAERGCVEVLQRGQEIDRFLRLVEWMRYWSEALNDRHELSVGLHWEYELIWEIGSALLKDRVIAAPEEILAMTKEDLQSLQRTGSGLTFRKSVQERLTDYQLRLRVKAPDKLGRSDGQTAAPSPVADVPDAACFKGKQLRGRGIGSSAATGEARLVTDLKDSRLLEQLGPSDILVLPGANDFHYADWHSLLTVIGGIVAIAHPSHHLAQVARECDVPVVGNVGQASVLRDGEKLHVDARRGVVEILD